MRDKFKRSLVLSLVVMFTAASICIGTAALAEPTPMRVTGMTPATGSPGTIVTIRGDNFGATQGSKVVAINLGHVNLMEVRSWSNTEIRAVVPNLPVGEYTIVVYYDRAYRTFAGWTGSPRFRIIPGEVPHRDPGPSTPPIEPPFPSRPSCAAVPGATNMLCNGDFDTVGLDGAAPIPVRLPSGGGAGNSAAKYWALFVNGGDSISSTWLESDRPGATHRFGQPPRMVHVTANNRATGILQQFLARDYGPQRVTFAVWVKVVSGKVSVSLGNWGLKLEGGWRTAATSTRTGKWELLSGCSIYDPKKPLPLNQIFIASSDHTTADFFLDFAEVKNADPAWKGGGCIEVH